MTGSVSQDSGTIPSVGGELLDLHHAAWRHQRLGVGDQRAAFGKQACPGLGRLGQAAQHQAGAHRIDELPDPRRNHDSARANGGGEDLCLDAKRLDLRIDQALLIAVERKKSANRHGEYEKVDRQNPPGQRTGRPPAQQPGDDGIV